MSSIRGARTEIGEGNIRGRRSTFRRMWSVMKIWTTTEIGGTRKSMDTSGIRASKQRTGRLITTATGHTSSLGDIRGSTTNRGALRHSIMGGGSMWKVDGDGYHRRRGLKA